MLYVVKMDLSTNRCNLITANSYYYKLILSLIVKQNMVAKISYIN